MAWITVKDYGWAPNHYRMYSSGKEKVDNYDETLFQRIINYINGVFASLKPGDILDSSLHTPWDLPVFHDLILAFGDHEQASRFYGVVLLRHMPDTWKIRKSNQSQGKNIKWFNTKILV